MTSPGPITPKTEVRDSNSPEKRSSTEEHTEASPTKKIATPRKKAAPKAPSTPKMPKAATPKTPASARKANAIPATWDEASDADRMLITMKNEGKTSKEIKAAYEKKTGKAVGDSTLSVRISRLKANFACLEPGHDLELLKAEQMFDEEMAKLVSGKHARIAAIMHDLGTPQYSTMLIQKEYKRIKDAQAAGTFVPSAQVDEGSGEEQMEEDSQDFADDTDGADEVIKGEDADGEE